MQVIKPIKKNLKFVFIVGPTGTGKSDWGLRLAKEFGGVIFNADSIQMYQELDIGSAKPSQDEFQQVPHFLFNIAKFPEVWTAGDYTRKFFSEVDALQKTVENVFVVGGTGFYIQALEKGLLEIGKSGTDFGKNLEAKLQENPEVAESELYEILLKLDPDYAKKISRTDHYRLVRALEIIETEKRSITDIMKTHQDADSQFPYPYLKIGIPMDKDWLMPRLEKRIQIMLDQGFVQEVMGLIAKYGTESLQAWGPMASVGYKEVLEALIQNPKLMVANDASEEILGLRKLMLHKTWLLAKKQWKWFKRDEKIVWDKDFEKVYPVVKKFLVSAD